ncbi:MAG: T9SS type A sorting domain-containing protein [Bacteroidales bacterium]|nr:T9SS type A sorting domain-containing protein [Bacteroidales bacterium]
MRFLLFLLLIVSINILPAQELQYEINPAAANVTKEDFKINWAIGGINYEAYQNNDIFLSSNWLYSDIPSGIEDIDKDENLIYLFPIPVKEKLNILVNHQCQFPIELKIFNVSGSLIHQRSISKESVIIDMTYFARGLYLVEFTNKTEGRKTYKIIKD